MNEQIDWSRAPEGATHCWTQAQDFFKLDNGSWMVWYGHEMRWAKSTIAERWGGLVERPSTPSWSGEGLPPVGVVCEINPDKAGWRKSVISYIGDGFLAWLQVGDLIVPEYGAFIEDCEFRPIRTPEQIAADDREAAVNDMHAIYMKGAVHGGGLYAIYDAGFRKEQK